MSCEAHRQQALSAILAAHPSKGLSPADAERIYQEQKKAHPALSYEAMTQLAGVVTQSGGAVTLDQAVTLFASTRASTGDAAREQRKDGFGGDDLVMADLPDDDDAPVSTATPKPVVMKRGGALAREIATRKKLVDQNKELAQVESWLRDSGTAYDDFEWDGQELTVFVNDPDDPDNPQVEKYNRQTLGLDAPPSRQPVKPTKTKPAQKTTHTPKPSQTKKKPAPAKSPAPPAKGAQKVKPIPEEDAPEAMGDAAAAPTSDTTALASFAAPYRAKFKKPEASILQRWKTRVLPAGLHKQGEAGAAAYLERYGKGIAAPKVVALALCAENEGAPEMAKGFWKKAYELETGVTLASNLPAQLPSTKFTGPAVAPEITLKEFPKTLQPGYFHTMQAVNPQFKDGQLANKAVDAMPTPEEVEQARELLIADNDYWAQPKRDGERRVVWAGKTQNAYQARSANVRGAASLEIDAALRAAAKQFGPCALDGEVYYPDVKGGEHRTASQAYNENVKLGHPEAPTPARYAIFTALYANGKDLRDGSQKARVEAGEKIGKWLEKKYPGVMELVPTARTKKEKAALCAKQKAEGREGEVWVKKDCAYRGGKQKGGDILRTKYTQAVDVVVTGVTHTSADKRGFGALSVGVYGADGKLRSLGDVGTGFNEDEQMEILRRVLAGEQMVVTVQTQGRTENGQLWAARFKDIRTDKAPEECVE